MVKNCLNLYGSQQLQKWMNDALLKSSADETEIVILTEQENYSRFVDGQISHPLERNNITITVRCLVNGRMGKVSVNSLEQLPTAVEKATKLAHYGKEIPGFHFASAQKHGANEVYEPKMPYYDHETAEIGAEQRAEIIRSMRRIVENAGAKAYGAVHNKIMELCVATSSGRFTYVPLTEAGCNIVTTRGVLSGMGYRVNRSFSEINFHSLAEDAVSKVIPDNWLASDEEPKTLPAGNYRTLLSGYAVSDMLTFLSDLGMNGRALHNGTGPLSEGAVHTLGSPDIYIDDDAAPYATSDGLPIPFDQEGITKKRVALVHKGEASACVNDLMSATALQATPTGHAHVSRMPVVDPVAANPRMLPGTLSEEELLKRLGTGVYVTNFHYTRVVDKTTGLITGMTRHGTFWVEDGRIAYPLKNLRFTDSIYETFRNVEAMGKSLYCGPFLNVFNSCALAPSLVVSKFSFSSSSPSEKED